MDIGARHSRLPRVAPGILMLMLSWALPAAAAGDLDITAVVGFADTFSPGHWTPLEVTVANRGQDLNGEIAVDVTGGDELQGPLFITSHRRRLELHRDTRKRFQFTVLPQSVSQPLVIRVRAQGRELSRTAVDLRKRFIAERAILVLSRNANLDYLNEGSADGLRVLYPHPERLPAHWRGYDAVEAVVVQGVSLDQLTASQFEALHKWIAQGGILALSGGADYAALRRPRLASLLPGLPSGMTRLDAAALREAFSDTLDVSRPVSVNRLAAFHGRVRLRAGTTALIVERALGRGRVLYFTFDVAGHPFDRWDGMRTLWLESLELPRPRIASTNDESAQESALRALIRADARQFPSHTAVVLFLALYLGVLLAACRSADRERRLSRLRRFGALIVPLLFAPAGWLLFGPAAFQRGPGAAAMAMIEPLPDSIYARLDLDLGLYATRSGAMRYEFRGAEPVWLRPRQPGQRREDWVLGDGARQFLEPADRRRYVLHALQGVDVIPFHLEVAVRDGRNGPRVILYNASGEPVRDAWLVLDRYAYPIGSIEDGARIEREFSRAQGLEVGAAGWRPILNRSTRSARQDTTPTRIALERWSRQFDDDPPRRHALLVGHTMSPLRPGGESASWPRQERTVLALRVAVAPSAAPAIEERR
jgi:hypothetical protein